MTIVSAPRINANDDQVGVVRWHVQDGGEIEVGGELVDLETSKAVVTVDATEGGRVRHIARLGDIVRVGVPLCEISEAISQPANGSITSTKNETALASTEATKLANGSLVEAASDPIVSFVIPPDKTQASHRFEMTRFSQEAERLLGELDLPETEFDGHGLVTQQVVRDRLSMPIPARMNASQSPAGSSTREPIATTNESLRSDRLSLSKRAEVEALTRGEAGLLNSTVAVYFQSAPIRERLSREGKFDGNIQPVILYELSRLLCQWPCFTAFFAGDAVNYYERVDIGLAMDLGRGLKVVTIKQADRLMPIDFHEAISDFGLRYLENKLTPSELVDSTITVTDLSSLDVLHFKPLINGRQSAIIGIGADAQQPGHMMCFSMTFDHRVSSGRDAGLFLQDLRHRVQSYAPTRPHLAAARGVHSACSIRCDRCGIDNISYHQNNMDAFMGAGFAADGRLIGICRACAMGYG